MKIYLSKETAELLRDSFEDSRISEPKVDYSHPQELYLKTIEELHEMNRDADGKLNVSADVLDLILEEFDWAYSLIHDSIVDKRINN